MPCVAYRYGSVLRRNFKIRKGLFRTGLTQDHHVIPREFRTHKVILEHDFDMNCSSNIVLMPTPIGKMLMNVRADRLTHGCGHKKYNMYVLSVLNCIKTKEELLMFRDHLKRSIRHEPHNTPWN